MLTGVVTQSVKHGGEKAYFEKGVKDLKSRNAAFSKLRAEIEVKNPKIKF